MAQLRCDLLGVTLVAVVPEHVEVIAEACPHDIAPQLGAHGHDAVVRIEPGDHPELLREQRLDLVTGPRLQPA